MWLRGKAIWGFLCDVVEHVLPVSAYQVLQFLFTVHRHAVRVNGDTKIVSLYVLVCSSLYPATNW